MMDITITRRLRLFSALLLTALFLLFGSQPLTAQEAASDQFEVQPLLIGQKIPTINLLRPDSSSVSLNRLLSKQPSILIFYRGGWCPYCNRHMAEIQSIEDDLINEGYQILAISADRPSRLPSSIKKHDINYTLLSDHTLEGTRKMGLAFTVSPQRYQQLKANGIDLEKASGMTHHQLPVPAIYIVSTDGTVLFNYVNPDYRRKVPSEVLKSAADFFIDDAKNS
jgi:peroxiredoxin